VIITCSGERTNVGALLGLVAKYSLWGRHQTAVWCRRGSRRACRSTALKRRLLLHSMSSSSQDAQDHSGQEQEVDPSFTCTVCMEVLLDPVTPPCGHSLDQRCMQKLVEARGKRACPTCRAVLPKDLPCVSVQFRDVVEQRYPKQVRLVKRKP
jgi:hypothetical protein